MSKSPYTNHVILTGLDEARAHQQGEDVGRKPRPGEMPQLEDKYLVRQTPQKRKPRGAYSSRLPAELRREIALAKGTEIEVAALFGVPKHTVSNARNALRKGHI